MRNGNSRKLIFTGIVLGGAVLGLLIYSITDHRRSSEESSGSARGDSKSSATYSSSPDSMAGGSNPARPANAADGTAVDGTTAFKTRSADRGALPDRSKLPVVDLMKSAEEIPAWPDGPRLLAEISTETKRFINLRPNNVGILPTINLGAEETVALRLDFPDNSPGDRIYVELVDGGFFLNSDKPGQVLTLGETKTLEVSMSSDSRAGHCKLFLRQAGHTRVIPFWVGPLLPIAQAAQN